MNTIISLKLKLVTGVVLMAFDLLGQDGVVRLQPTAYGDGTHVLEPLES